MQALWDSAGHVLFLAKPFLAALAAYAALVAIGDRGSRFSLRRNNPCLAALCIFTFALGSGMTTWFLVMQPVFAMAGAAFALSYPLILMYWSFWLLVGVLISAKKLIYDNPRRLTVP